MSAPRNMDKERTAAGTLLAARLLMVVDGLPALGVDANAVLLRAGLTRDTLSAPDGARVHARSEHRLWRAIEAEAGDCTIGLRFAALYLQAGMPSIEGYLARNAASLRAVLHDMDRFAGITDDRLRMVLSEHENTATIRMLRDHAPDRAQGYVECHFAIMVGFAHRYVGAVPLWQVNLCRAKPRRLAPYRAAFAGVTPAFDQPHNEMLFPRRALDQPVRGAEPALARILEEHAKLLVQRVPREDPLIRRIRAALAQDIEHGHLHLGQLTKRLGLSERTLRRRLLARDTSYQALIDELRRELACKLLAEDHPVQTIAERTGFQSTSAFQKAFTRWTHQTPSQYRRSLRG